MTTKHRFTSQGTAWFNEPRPDRNRVRDRGARFERPAGELGPIAGALLLACAVGVIVAAVLFLNAVFGG